MYSFLSLSISSRNLGPVNMAATSKKALLLMLFFLAFIGYLPRWMINCRSKLRNQVVTAEYDFRIMAKGGSSKAFLWAESSWKTGNLAVRQTCRDSWVDSPKWPDGFGDFQ